MPDAQPNTAHNHQHSEMFLAHSRPGLPVPATQMFFSLQGHWRGSLKVQALKTKGGQGQKTSSESLISIASIDKLLRDA